VRIVPDGCVDLVWMPSGIEVVGPDTRARCMWAAPGDYFAGVRFRPGAAPPILGVPASELLDLQLEFELVWGSSATRVCGAPASEQLTDRLALLQGLVESRVAWADRPDPLVGELVRQLRMPAATLDGIADSLGVSHRQLRRRCERAVGYGPKMLQRVLRFQHSLALARRTRARLAAVALAAGYADQAHFTREYRVLAGVPPSELTGRRL
jgi:AraC-like DNA-binding protein